jgi:hypothetical protein
MVGDMADNEKLPFHELSAINQAAAANSTRSISVASLARGYLRALILASVPGSRSALALDNSAPYRRFVARPTFR